MERNSNTEPNEHAADMLKGIGSVHDDLTLSSKHHATTNKAHPMAEELREMSQYGCNENKESHTEPSRRWLAIDRSRILGVDRPWDALAYVGTRKHNGQKQHGQQQPQPGSTKSSSLDVERGSVV